MTSRPCERCSGELPLRARRDARFCSTRCRVAAHRARPRVPSELAERPRWVRYSARKVPLTVAGEAASSMDVRTWCDYASAVRSRAGVGVGFVLNGDGIACLDLDHCLDERGRLASWARAVVDMLPDTYIEVSPSGDGLHVWGYGRVGNRCRVPVPGGSVEAYSAGRYITVTGRVYSAGPLADLSEGLAELTR